jgi:uncharacterized membrane protein YfcA
MDGTLIVLLVSLFIGAVVSGLAGFAMGVIVSAVWLHIIPPLQCAVLIVGYGLITQGYGAWKLRHAFSWSRVRPFVFGGAIGVPVGTLLMAQINPDHLRLVVAGLIILYSVYGLTRPAIKVAESSTSTDVGVGFANGLLAGLTGFIGIVITVWCQMRGWPKDVQRTVFQPVMLIVSVMSAISLGSVGAITPDTLKLFLIGVPVVFAGVWVGLRLYGRVNETAFRNLVLWLLMLCGVGLLVSKVA